MTCADTVFELRSLHRPRVQTQQFEHKFIAPNTCAAPTILYTCSVYLPICLYQPVAIDLTIVRFYNVTHISICGVIESIPSPSGRSRELGQVGWTQFCMPPPFRPFIFQVMIFFSLPTPVRDRERSFLLCNCIPIFSYTLFTMISFSSYINISIDACNCCSHLLCMPFPVRYTYSQQFVGNTTAKQWSTEVFYYLSFMCVPLSYCRYIFMCIYIYIYVLVYIIHYWVLR